MTIAADLYTELTTAISTDVSGRIYSGAAPVVSPLPLPMCIYQIAQRHIDHDLDGPTSLRHTHVIVDIYAATYAIASPIAEKVVTALGAWRDIPNGRSVTVTDAGTETVDITVQPNLKRVSMTFVIHHYNA